VNTNWIYIKGKGNLW